MKIAVPYDAGMIFPHFGKTTEFLMVEAENQTILSQTVVPTQGRGHGAISAFLREQGVDTVICGGIGEGAQMALAQAGIQLFGGASGDAVQAAKDLLQGTLRWNPLLQLGGFSGCGHHCSGQHCC